VVTRRDYRSEAVIAAKSVLIELVHLLGAYRDQIVLVGGWVPELLLGEQVPPHTGSLDIDLALDHRRLQEEGYRTIQELLLTRGYRPGSQPYKFVRQIVVDDAMYNVEVDLVAGEYKGTGRSRRHQKMQGVLARKARGCDLAFESPTELTVEGKLPGGGRDRVVLRVASIVPFLVMKGMALADRVKEKDAWDVYYCIRNYPGGMDALVEEFRPLLSNGLVQEGLKKIGDAFASIEHWGPVATADFDEIMDPDERVLRQRDAYERVNLLLKSLGTKA
jgi:hypothetical protein